MKLYTVLTLALVLVVATSVFAFEKKAYQMRDDFGTEPLQDATLAYFYYIPCPTYSWFWGYYGWETGDIVGEFFTVGDISTLGYDPADPVNCHDLMGFVVLDFAGYGTAYPGPFTVQFDVYCSDENGCPVGPSLWNSGDMETAAGWNVIDVDPPISICDCAIDPGPPPSAPRILITATMVGYEATYPAWGLDNIGYAVAQGCVMHDVGCLPALYPRPYNSHYTTIHSGYYGVNFEYCPPAWFLDGYDTTPDGTLYGFIELAWRIYLICSGPTATEPSTWGNIKSMYR